MAIFHRLVPSSGEYRCSLSGFLALLFWEFNRFELPRGRRCGPEGPACFILTPEPEISKSIDHRKKRWIFSKNLDNFRNENVSFTRKPRITPNNTFPILAHCVVCSPRTHKICINQGLHYYSKSTSMQANM